MRAAASGVVFLEPDVKAGTVITMGDSLGTISSLDEGLSVRIYVSAADRELVAVGDPVSVTVPSLPSVEYGKLSGTVSAIDADVTTLANEGYRREDAVVGISIEIEEYVLTRRDGTRHPLGNGTVVRAELVYAETSYLEYLGSLVGVIK